jgi:hypothetical protein
MYRSARASCHQTSPWGDSTQDESHTTDVFFVSSIYCPFVHRRSPMSANQNVFTRTPDARSFPVGPSRMEGTNNYVCRKCHWIIPGIMCSGCNALLGPECCTGTCCGKCYSRCSKGACITCGKPPVPQPCCSWSTRKPNCCSQITSSCECCGFTSEGNLALQDNEGPPTYKCLYGSSSNQSCPGMTNPDDLVDLLRGAAVYARDPRPDSYAGKNVLGTDMSVHLTRNSLIKDFPCGLIPPVPKRELILQERVVFQQTFSTTSCVSEMGAVTGAGPSPLSTRSAAQIFTDARSRQITLKAMYRLVPPSLKGPAPLCVQLEHPVNRAQEMATDIFGWTSKEFEADELIIRLNKVTMRHTSSNGAMGPLFAVLTTKPIVTPAMSLRIQAICLVALSNAIHICTETSKSATKTTI